MVRVRMCMSKDKLSEQNASTWGERHKSASAGCVAWRNAINSVEGQLQVHAKQTNVPVTHRSNWIDMVI